MLKPVINWCYNLVKCVKTCNNPVKSVKTVNKEPVEPLEANTLVNNSNILINSVLWHSVRSYYFNDIYG